MKKTETVNYRARFKLSYDPDDVNIRLQHFRVFELVSMIENKSIQKEDFILLNEIKSYNTERRRQISIFDGEEYIDIQGDDGLQRNSALWNNQQKSQFIESLMINLPIPLFYLDGSRRPWRIVDGLQRLYTIMIFLEEKFRLSGLEYLEKECNGKTFKEIPGYLRSRILNAEIIAYVINPGTPPDVKYNIFKRINTGGLKLTGQEIRNAFFRGKPADFTKKLASEDAFKKATNGKVTSRRMIDREFANRFIAFQIFNYNDYNGKMDNFLSEAMMELFDKSDDSFSTLHFSFIRSLERAYKLFEGFAFYRPKIDNDWGRQPNKALFDTLSWNLNEMTEKDFEKLSNKKRYFKKQYFHFMNNDRIMFRAIDSTTSSITSVVNRFTRLNVFLNDFVQ